MAYKVDVFGNTGFDSVNIPCAPDLLYTDEFSDCLLRQYEDMWILQDEIGQYIQVEEENAEEILSCDYVIVYDEDYGPSEDWLKKATCFIVKSAQMLSPNTCRVYLMKDPYNTMGGFDHRYNHNNIVIAGSVQRISVPMIKYTDLNGHTEEDAGYEHYKAIWPQRENDDFFTLEEPFQPSQKCIMNYQPFTPAPVPPEPINPDDFRYSFKNVSGLTKLNVNKYPDLPPEQQYRYFRSDGTGWEEKEPSNIIEENWINCGRTPANNEISKAQYIDNIEITVRGGLTLLANNVPQAHPMFANHINSFMLEGIVSNIREYLTTHNPVKTASGYGISVTIRAFYIRDEYNWEFWTNKSQDTSTLTSSTVQMNPFDLVEGLWYRVHIVPGGFNGYFIDINSDGTIKKEE